MSRGDRVCPRCGAPAEDEAVWCEGCGLNLKREKELPSADAYSARTREERWLEQQEAEKKERAEVERKREAEALAEKDAVRKQREKERNAEREARRQQRRQAIHARRAPLLGAGLALAAIAVLLVAWHVTKADVPVIGKSPFLSNGSPGSLAEATRDVPASDVAVIDDASINVPGLVQGGHISKADFNRFLLQTAKQSRLQSVPQPSDPHYQQLKTKAMQTALQIAWIVGEANKEGITFTDTELQQALQQIKSQFKTQAEYVQARDQAGLTEADVLERAKLQLIQNKIQNKIQNSVRANGSSGSQQAAQQSALTNFGRTFRESWRRRTVCAPGYIMSGCANGPPLATAPRLRTTP